MTIVEWSDSNFTKDNLIISQSDSSHKRTAKHRKRQGVFYHSCIRHLQKQNRTWTAFIDVDEVRYRYLKLFSTQQHQVPLHII